MTGRALPRAAMTSSPPSGSEPGASAPAEASSSFELLARPVQRWIWQKQWRELRDIQERAIPLLLREDADVIIAAATAGGKTEAAFLPLLSRLVSSKRAGRGFELLYVSPLKALINDQFRRLDELCELLEVPVHRWHGDVASVGKAKARRDPRGVLLITPESLEALFVLRGLEVPGLFAALECIVIDELHAMLDTERGVHLRSLLNRIEIAIGRPVRRVGLSATLGDMHLARVYLRPSAPDEVKLLKSDAEGQELKVQLRGHTIERPVGPLDEKEQESEKDGGEAAREEAADRTIARHLFERLRGQQNLVFAGSRQRVELYTDLLRQMSEEARLPNEFYAHHANLARDHREFVERRLKRAEEPTTAVCTSTLELGIDIGEVESVAQIGPPFSVASLRQRLGRSGRRAGKPAILRMYVKERAVDANSNPMDVLRLQLVQSIAMIDLLVAGWCEPARHQALHLSTLVHQVLSIIAGRGGVRAKTLFAVLCGSGPFTAVDAELFAAVLRRLGDPDVALIEQGPDGTLLLGATGERLVEHYSFYAVFMTLDEYRVVEKGHTLGTLPVTFILVPDMTIIFSGRRWRVLVVHDREKVVEVTPDAAGTPPIFGGDAGDLHDEVAKRMLGIYRSSDVPPYLDSAARDLLAEGRQAFHRYGLDTTSVLSIDRVNTLLFPWRGTAATESLALALVSKGLRASPRHVVIEASAVAPEVVEALKEISRNPASEATELAEYLQNLRREKFHPYLSRSLLVLDAAAGRVAAEDVPALAQQLAGR